MFVPSIERKEGAFPLWTEHTGDFPIPFGTGQVLHQDGLPFTAWYMGEVRYNVFNPSIEVKEGVPPLWIEHTIFDCNDTAL